MTPAHIEINISCNDFLTGMSCCSKNRHADRVIYRNDSLQTEPKRAWRRFKRKKIAEINAENSEARRQFNIYLQYHFNVDAQTLCKEFGEGDWNEKLQKHSPLSEGELITLCHLAETGRILARNE